MSSGQIDDVLAKREKRAWKWEEEYERAAGSIISQSIRRIAEQTFHSHNCNNNEGEGGTMSLANAESTLQILEEWEEGLTSFSGL